MPTQPPRFRAGLTRARKAWTRSRTAAERVRGRKGVATRRRILAEEPLCRLCLEAGLVVASTQVDHIVSLSQGGSDERSNKQGICDACHRAKTAAESAAGRRRPPPTAAG